MQQSRAKTAEIEYPESDGKPMAETDVQFTALTFRYGLLAERQSLRGVRRLSPDSAEALDELLPAMEAYRSMPLSMPEGQTVSACRYCELRGRAGQYCA
jgi:hypothetical protein